MKKEKRPNYLKININDDCTRTIDKKKVLVSKFELSLEAFY